MKMGRPSSPRRPRLLLILYFAVALDFLLASLLHLLALRRVVDRDVPTSQFEFDRVDRAAPAAPADDDPRPRPLTRVFYNLFAGGPEDESRVRAIVDEQLGLLIPDLHDASSVAVTSIGHRLADLPPGAYVREHAVEGGEELTLRALWEHCRANDDPRETVAYLHSKGSFHPTEDNRHLRRFVTRGALSEACANLPEGCDVCSSRMSPLPHPHSPGNMWVARCDYVARLFDPTALERGLLPPAVDEWNPCKGRGRFLGEHWVYSHPSVRPCDLYPGSEYVWGYVNVSRGDDWDMDPRAAPRFAFGDYAHPKGWCRTNHPETLEMDKFATLRRRNYELLYNVTDLGNKWWGWDFLERSGHRRRRRRRGKRKRRGGRPPA